ncbi:prospero homeobox protein 2 [Conger conger]|uniref:prospero homeobox protein 2 n=1 Tax=Conger conger TaxID=82655 RepID=UPI002A5A05CA|nr:prospero homeobox protein 2 [Conger conger]
MNLSLSDQSMHTSSEGYPEEEKGELLHPCFRRSMYDDSLTTYSNGSIISQLLRKTIQSKRVLEDNLFYLPATTVSSSTMADSSQEDQSSNSSKESMVELASPGSHPSVTASPPADRPLNEHHQAKRARVENIIRGMAGSPNARVPGEGERSEADGRDAREAYRENKRKQRLPQHQEHSLGGGPGVSRGGGGSKEEECQRLKEQLQTMQRLLRQLQEKFFQVYNLSDSEQEDREEVGLAGSMECEEPFQGSDSELHGDQDSDFEKRTDSVKAGRRGAVNGGHFSFHKEGKNLPETLKHELSRAVSESVDLVFKKFSSTLSPQLQMGQVAAHVNIGPEKKTQILCVQEQPLTEESMKTRALEYYESAEVQIPEDQTEALSLVVRKPPLNHPNSVNQAVKRPYPVHQAPFQFSYSAPLHENQILEHLLKYGPHGNFGSLPCLPPGVDRSSPDSVDLPWDTLSARPKVSSTQMVHHARSTALGQVAMDSLCLPHVKMECGDLQSLAERNPYMSLNIQEGLTPNHLKKAKLMFFYTRYPSSNVLKTFFPDVKFNRCITSQLIKWFSNFREFYYIQMEKFARQAIVDGVNSVTDMSVTRDSELFRALNMHYNKANDFQVPDRFLEVAEITLQEFFNAISMTKDTDPSWKKAIYKVICKLDSDVPDEFKSSNCV